MVCDAPLTRSSESPQTQGPRLIAVGGGKGGVGHSLVAANLAIFLVQLGKKVVLVDAHPEGAHLGSAFGVARASGALPPWAPSSPEARARETVVPNLRLVEAASEMGPRPGVSLRHPRELARSTETHATSSSRPAPPYEADFCVLDLGAGSSPAVLDAMLDADVIVSVTTPEPPPIEATYRLVRHLYARRVLVRLRDLGDAESVRLLDDLVTASHGPPLPYDLARWLAERSPEVAAVVWGELARLKVRLVVNQSRSRADLDLGEAMARVTLRRMSVALEFLGHVEYDEAVFLAARRRRPLLVDAPAAKASRNLERIARRLLALDAGRLAATPPGKTPDAAPPPPTHYELLALDRGASDEEIRRAYRKTREVYSSESLCLAGLFTEEETSALVAKIEEARDVLLDPSRRRPYDLSITPPEEARMYPPEVELTEADLTIASVALPEITPETEFTGSLLKAVREARGVELRDVVARTRISLQYLQAIEEEDYAVLPPLVYTRGFVAEVARTLKLDVEQVTRTWLRRYRKAQEK